jgi:uncharacterized membrane protein
MRDEKNLTGVNELKDRFEGLNRRVSLLLQVTISISLILIAGGLVIHLFTGEPLITGLTPVTLLITGFLELDAAAYITAGFIIMLLMPLMILITAFIHFISTRETKPLVVCIVLLLMLAASYVLILK